jgi:hypothetical protein
VGYVANEDGQGLAGATVQATTESESGVMRSFRVLSEASGKFELGPLVQGPVEIRVEKRGYVALESVEMLVPELPRVHSYALQAGHDLTVLLMGGDGQPVEGAQVHARLSDGRIVHSEESASGEYQLHDLPGENVALEVSVAGRLHTTQLRGDAGLLRMAVD